MTCSTAHSNTAVEIVKIKKLNETLKASVIAEPVPSPHPPPTQHHHLIFIC